MREMIPIIEAVLRDYSEKRTIMPPRVKMDILGSPGTIRAMLAAIPDEKISGFKALTGTAGQRQPRGTYFVVMLFDTDGSVTCVMSANRLTQLRTGAASAVATKYLARKRSGVLGIIGGGVQGLAQVEAMGHVLRIEKVLVHDISAKSARRTEEFIQERLGWDSRIHDSPDDLVKQVDVLITSTTSSRPVFDGTKIKPGTHINAIGSNMPTRRELDVNTLKRSKVIVDSLEQAPKESGDLLEPVSTGEYSVEQIHGEIGEIISGKKMGRECESEITLFKSVGIAVEDVAAAQHIYRLALKSGAGKEFDMS